MSTNLSQNINAIFRKLESANYKKNKALRLSAHWHIGRLLHLSAKEDVNIGTSKEKLYRSLTQNVKTTFVKKVSSSMLKKMLCFYEAYPDWEKVQDELSWTHYQLLMEIDTPYLRTLYTKEAAANHWTAEDLERQMKAQYFERQLLLINRDQREDEETGVPYFLKDNYVLEFTGLSPKENYREHDLENALLDQLQSFMMELGKGFSFVARQKRLVTSTGKQFFIDLVFYHFILRRFVLIDLKVEPLSHRDIGQMDMYVRLYEKKWRTKNDLPTIGILLCPEKDETLEAYSMLSDSEQLFASTYQLNWPASPDEHQQSYLNNFHQTLHQLTAKPVKQAHCSTDPTDHKITN